MKPDIRQLEAKYGRFVQKQARKYARNDTEYQDMYQIGLIALWRSALTYNPGPATFLSFAAYRIRGDMLREAQKYARWETPSDTQEFDVTDEHI